jgi:hypothetical protein
VKIQPIHSGTATLCHDELHFLGGEIDPIPVINYRHEASKTIDFMDNWRFGKIARRLASVSG